VESSVQCGFSAAGNPESTNKNEGSGQGLFIKESYGFYRVYAGLSAWFEWTDGGIGKKITHPAFKIPGKHMEIRLTETGADLYYGGEKVYTIDKSPDPPSGEYRFGCATYNQYTGFSDLRYNTKFSPKAVPQPWNYISFGDGGLTKGCDCKKNEICLDPKQKCSWGRFCGDLADEYAVVDDWQACRASCDADVDCTAFTYTDGCTAGKKQCHKSTGAAGCEASKMKMTACTVGTYVSAKKAVSMLKGASQPKTNWKLIKKKDKEHPDLANFDLSYGASSIKKGGNRIMMTWSTATDPTDSDDPSTSKKQ